MFFLETWLVHIVMVYNPYDVSLHQSSTTYHYLLVPTQYQNDIANIYTVQCGQKLIEQNLSKPGNKTAAVSELS